MRHTFPGMKTAVSIPDRTFRAADQLARRLGLTRSALYARAVAEFLQRHDDAWLTARLDEVYGTPTVADGDAATARRAARRAARQRLASVDWDASR